MSGKVFYWARWTMWRIVAAPLVFFAGVAAIVCDISHACSEMDALEEADDTLAWLEWVVIYCPRLPGL